jgi:glycerol-3-phosphate acyltransferase PlsY
MIYLLAILLAYLIGAFPSGVVVVRIARGFDVRTVGSRRSGATNVWRASGFLSAAIVFVLDVFKGTAAVWLGRWMAGSATLHERWHTVVGHAATWPLASPVPTTWIALLCGLAAIAGHNWPVYIRFKGGRGVATTVGTCLPLAPALIAIVLVIGAAAALTTRYVSLGSVVGAVLIPVALLAQILLDKAPWGAFFYGLAVGGLIIVQHLDNIARLRAGTERKIGEAVKPPPAGGQPAGK